MPDEVSVRRRDAAATKAALLVAAQELFAERGFERTTVRDIAAHAGVNQALLFRYFGSKDALFHTALANHSQQLLAETRPEQLVARLLQWLLSPDTPKATDNPLYALLRSCAHEGSAAVFREDIGAGFSRAFTLLTDAPDAEVRADLVLAWLLGIGLLRSVLGKEPLASTEPRQVAEHVLRTVALLLERSDPRLPKG